eukprot:jgi/Tetstr1/464698/TSEL_009449.t1
MPKGEEPVSGPTLESLHADAKAQYTLLRVLDVFRAPHFQHASEHLGSAIVWDLMRDYERRVFEATVASSAKASATARVMAAAAGAVVDVGVVVDAGVAAKVSANDGVGRLSSELLEPCEVTFR